MNLIKVITLFLAYFNSINCCEFFETKRTCECSASYISNNDTKRKILFEIPSYDDCGIDLGCDFAECRKKCINSIRAILNNENSFNSQARNKVCELISPKNEAINKIYVWASWKYSSCKSGNEPLIEDLCCNKKCKCSLVSQLVSPNLNESLQSLVEDLSYRLPTKEKSYECSYRLQDECQSDCMSLVSDYFRDTSLKNLNPNMINYNVFFKETASNKVCQTFNKQISKPGVDVYVKIDTKENNNLIKYISLGRVCCQQQCKCDILFKDALNGSLAKDPIELNTKVSNIGYECSNELSNCITLCRKKGIELAFNFPNQIEDEYQTSLDLNILEIRGYRKHMCNLLNVTTDSRTGYNVYLRYTLNDKSFPYTEDIHLGRFCCSYSLSNFIGTNRCQRTND